MLASALLLAGRAAAQGQTTPPASATPAPNRVPATSADAPVHQAANQPNKDHGWSLHFQQTIIKQWHSEFASPYDDTLSLQPREKAKLSLTTTLFIGRRLWKGGALFFNPEVSGGSGLSGASGVAGPIVVSLSVTPTKTGTSAGCTVVSTTWPASFCSSALPWVLKWRTTRTTSTSWAARVRRAT
ncbi:MAG: hypothetical protein NVS3B25_05190 [Hymenobacter sp.]